VYIIEFISYTRIKFLSKVFYRNQKINLVSFFITFLKIRKSYGEDSFLLLYITKPKKKKTKTVILKFGFPTANTFIDLYFYEMYQLRYCSLKYGFMNSIFV